MAQVTDIRGRRVAAPRPPVLLDPSGGRARVLAWTGRAVAGVFSLWLVGLAFAGLGLIPSGALPLGQSFTSQAPPPLHAMPRLTQPQLLVTPSHHGPSATGADRVADPTLATDNASAGGATRGRGGAHGAGTSTTAGRRPPASIVAGAAPGAVVAPGNGTAASTPAQQPTSHGHGHRAAPSSSGKAVAGSRSGTAPAQGVKRGQTKTTTTTTTTTPTGSGQGVLNGRRNGSANRP